MTPPLSSLQGRRLPLYRGGLGEVSDNLQDDFADNRSVKSFAVFPLEI